ncbi:MAG: hypothetical protein AAFP84_15290 [Actinomycetota bacterium]
MTLEVVDAARIEELFNDGVDRSDPFTVLALANLAVERLRHADTSGLSGVERRHFVQGVEHLRNQADAAAVAAAGELDEAGHDRESGFFTTAAWLRHHLGVSNTESRARLQLVRMFRALPD